MNRRHPDGRVLVVRDRIMAGPSRRHKPRTRRVLLNEESFLGEWFFALCVCVSMACCNLIKTSVVYTPEEVHPGLLCQMTMKSWAKAGMALHHVHTLRVRSTNRNKSNQMDRNELIHSSGGRAGDSGRSAVSLPPMHIHLLSLVFSFSVRPAWSVDTAAYRCAVIHFKFFIRVDDRCDAVF